VLKSNAAFIEFAVRQARDAEAFGFTRNECCRNLKLALHQYWQNKTLGMHGQAHKSRIPRSRAATGLSLGECVVEHAVPQMELVNRLMELEPLTEQSVAELLKQSFCVMLVTKEEHARLNASGFRYSMPPGWNQSDLYARYRMLGIEPVLPS
jgi:hypothetical protein